MHGKASEEAPSGDSSVSRTLSKGTAFVLRCWGVNARSRGCKVLEKYEREKVCGDASCPQTRCESADSIQPP